MMKVRSTRKKAVLINLTTYGLLAGAALLSFRMPRQLTVKWAYAESEHAIANFVGDRDRIVTAADRTARDESPAGSAEVQVVQRQTTLSDGTLRSP